VQRTTALALTLAALATAPAAEPANLVKNPLFTAPADDVRLPAHYTLTGSASWAVAGRRDEFAPHGVALDAGKGRDAAVWQDVTGFDSTASRWFRFSFRGLPGDNFAVTNDDLFMKVEFYGRQGDSYLDCVTRKIYPLVERDRHDLAVNGNGRRGGAAVWKTYAFEFKLPFPEVDRLRLIAGFRNGAATGTTDSAFYVSEFSLVPIPDPASQSPKAATPKGPGPSLAELVHLGGRWYYRPENVVDKSRTVKVTAANADRLFYKDAHLTNPFAENMTAWLRKGYLDLGGKVVTADRFVSNNVAVEFTDGKTMTLHVRGLPNHATGQFPGPYGPGGWDPHYIQEQDATYRIPLDPKPNPKAVAMTVNNSNRALPMGPIGVAVNGVVFFNPFDADMTDATDVMDRCCGHPAPGNQYHYHKYPVCVKSPFVDDGEEHSPLIGWALDGFPIYGPYESKVVMAKDGKDRPLNDFNVHFDEARGWHYHATPGKFPYVIGGYYGEADARMRRGPRPRGE
jgi:hypothetical protein